MQTILDASVRAANASNAQSYAIIVVEDQTVMKEASGYVAPVMLLYCVDLQRNIDLAQHLGCTYSYVADLETATRFYVDVLSARSLKDVTDAAGRAFVRFLRLGDGVLELFERKNQAIVHSGHLAVQVDNAVETCAAIRAAGYHVDQPVHRPSGNLIALLKDPDGHDIEIIQHSPGMDPQTWR